MGLRGERWREGGRETERARELEQAPLARKHQDFPSVWFPSSPSVALIFQNGPGSVAGPRVRLWGTSRQNLHGASRLLRAPGGYGFPFPPTCARSPALVEVRVPGAHAAPPVGSGRGCPAGAGVPGRGRSRVCARQTAVPACPSLRARGDSPDASPGADRRLFSLVSFLVCQQSCCFTASGHLPAAMESPTKEIEEFESNSLKYLQPEQIEKIWLRLRGLRKYKKTSQRSGIQEGLGWLV
nr:uncharacterized protein LOC105475932 isoform X4 [Macaca nemestrina]